MPTTLPQPRFEIGQAVEVLINQRNRARHTGKVARAVWHHKDSCYNYYMEVDGRKVSKRYLAEDFVPVSHARDL